MLRIDKKNSLTALLAVLSISIVGVAHAEAEARLEKAENDVSNVASLQRGARNFVNYCYGCHSLQYVRYNRIEQDLGLNDEQIQKLMFTGERPTDKMQNAMAASDAQHWFNKEPPDLSLIARSRGTDYLYTFLKSFYIDPSRPTGVNNLVLPNAAMPHVLWELQGLQRKDELGKAVAEGDIEKHFAGFEPVTKGKLTAAEYDGFVRDTVNFLDYVGEPVQLVRRNVGMGVVAFLLVFFGFAFFLKQEYWKDVK
jgi:ubiquinol-cytochrome c reductase cytochrome c1 subunit